MDFSVSPAESLQRRWKNIRFYLERAVQQISNIDQVATTDGSEESELLLFSEYLEHNEFELALDELVHAGEKGSVEGKFWLLLSLAARGMKMLDRSQTLLLRYQHGTADSLILQAITNSALAELDEKKLGVTQQFLQVHEVDENPLVLSQYTQTKKRGDTFIRLKSEPFYWVVQSEPSSDRDGDWRATWAYCSHHANVYLKIAHEHLSAETITDYLGFCPDESAAKGAPIRPRAGSRCFDTHRWYLKSPAAKCKDFAIQLEDLLAAIEPFAKELNELQSTNDCLISVAVALYDSVGWPYGYGLSQAAIRQLAIAGLPLDFDVYHSGPEVPDE